jgi:hypothetical protein
MRKQRELIEKQMMEAKKEEASKAADERAKELAD